VSMKRPALGLMKDCGLFDPNKSPGLGEPAGRPLHTSAQSVGIPQARITIAATLECISLSAPLQKTPEGSIAMAVLKVLQLIETAPHILIRCAGRTNPIGVGSFRIVGRRSPLTAFWETAPDMSRSRKVRPGDIPTPLLPGCFERRHA
jgi:hypothetical protein